MRENTQVTFDCLIAGVLLAWIPGPVYWLTLLMVTVVDQVGDYLVDLVATSFADRALDPLMNRSGLASKWNHVLQPIRTAFHRPAPLLRPKQSDEMFDSLPWT